MEVNEETAELVGILLGDGSISKYQWRNQVQHRIQVTFHSEQIDYIHYVSDLCLKTLRNPGKIKFRKKEKTADLRIISRKLVEELLSLGMIISPKWNRAAIPEVFINEQLGKHLLRGYFDTDGSVVIANNNGTTYPRLEMKISPAPMQKQLIRLLDMYNFKYGCYSIGKGKVRIQLNGKEQLKKWNDTIGSSNQYYIKRLQKFL